MINDFAFNGKGILKKGYGTRPAGLRVQRVQKVQKVQRVVVAADAADYKKGAAAGAAGCVEGLHRFAQGATALWARRLWYRRFAAMSIYARLRRENHKTAPSARGKCPQGGWLVFHRAKSGCKGFHCLQAAYKIGARKDTHFASAAILYNSPGRMPSNRPGGEAGPGQKLWPGAAAHGPSTLAPARAR